ITDVTGGIPETDKKDLNEWKSQEDEPCGCTPVNATSGEDSYRTTQDHINKKELNEYASRLAMAAETDQKSITIIAQIFGQNARVLLDSGATGNYISQEYTRQHKIPTKQTNEWATILMDKQHYEAVLGMGWLKEHNPIIDWAKGTVAVDTIKLKTTINDEKIMSLREESGQIHTRGKAEKSNGESLVNEGRKVTSTSRKEQENETTTSSNETTAKPKPRELYGQELKQVKEKLPEKYHEFIELFVKDEYRLPAHEEQYEAKIPLKPGTEIPPVKQHRKSRDELKVEQEFVTKFLQAGYIRESKSKLSDLYLSTPGNSLKQNETTMFMTENYLQWLK
ncbi:hypothetical protein V1508DRAFT_436169, partial [Lipomyces doorenjongii]|uniref:uncharacterized protein n=1 Tax=Lipomyces doorenjongii TaxID=383834 RepID=UPI0034CDEC07